MIRSAAERQLLVALADLVPEGTRAASLREIRERGEAYFCGYLVDWNGAADSLAASGLIERSRGKLSLTDDGIETAASAGARRPRFHYWYSHWYLRASRSRAHSDLCKRAYGIDLCQTGMATRSQIEMIGDLIASRTRPRVLDLGCGAGMIDEYLSDECMADVTGIDVVTAGIRLARDRTKDKRERLRFFLKDMREYPQDPTGYDMIMSLDTLYFLGAEGNGLLFEKRYAEAAAFAGMASDGTLTRYLYSTVPR